MERSRAVLLGLLAGCLPVAFATGLGGPGALVLAAVGLVGYSTITTVRSRAAAPDRSWATPGVSFEFAAAEPRVAATGGVTGALGRVESRLLLGSVAFWVGIGFGALSVWLFGWAWSGESGGDVGRMAELVPWLVHPLAGMVLVAAHRARTRARRDGTAELFAACPTGEHQRDLAHLATAWVGALVAIVVGTALLITFRARVDIVWGPFGARQVALVLGGGVLVAGATALGVLLARWAPWGVTPVLAILVIGAGVLQAPAWAGGDADGVAQLSTAPPVQGFDWLDATFTAPRWLAHQAWIAALVVLVVVLVVWHGNRRRATSLPLAAAVVTVAVAGWAATRPVSASDAERIASMIAEPERHQHCVDLGVPLCVYPGNGALVDGFRPHVQAVLAAVPAGAEVGRLTFRQGADVRLDDLSDEIAARLAGWRPADDVPPVKLSTEGYDAARFWLALAATGIFDETSRGGVVDVAGQARGVVAIWLATRGVPEERALAEMASLPPPPDHGELLDVSRPWPDPCLAGPTPVQWAHGDLDAARRLIVMPEADVVAVVHRRWDRWLDPATTTDELLGALGIAPVGPTQGRTPVVGPC